MPEATPPVVDPPNKRFRAVEVRRVERVTPKTVRVVLGGDALEGFGAPLLGGHIKVMLPGTDQVRAYTPKRFDAARREIEIEVILHGDSPGSRWAAAARTGDAVDLRGPGGRGHTGRPDGRLAPAGRRRLRRARDQHGAGGASRVRPRHRDRRG